MPILWDVISQNDQKKLRQFMPKYWRPKRTKEKDIQVDIKVKVTAGDIKDMTKTPQGPMR